MIGRGLLLSLLITAPAFAADLPDSVGGDQHIQSVAYSPDHTVLLKGQLGFQTMIEFQPDERIENVAIGDSTAWQVTPNKRANILFVKPIAAGGPSNLTVVTDKRRYMIALAPASAKAATVPTAWVLRFRVPAPVQPVKVVATPATAVAPYRNVNYTMTGPGELMPSAVYDDGVRTYFAWADNAAIPAIFAVNPDGSESVTNPSMRDGKSVVDQVAGQFVLRSGTSKATVTSSPGVQRSIVKGGSK